MSIQSLPTRTAPATFTLRASAWSSFATPAITVPFPSAYPGQTQIPFIYTAAPRSSKSRQTIGQAAATGAIVPASPASTGTVTNGGSTGSESINSNSNNKPILPLWAIIVIAVVGGIAIIAFILGVYCCARSKKKKRNQNGSQNLSTHQSQEDMVDSGVMREKRDRKFRVGKVTSSPKQNFFGISGIPNESRPTTQRQRSAQSQRLAEQSVQQQVNPQLPPPASRQFQHDPTRSSFDSSTPLNPPSREAYANIEAATRRQPPSPQRERAIGMAYSHSHEAVDPRRRVQSERSHYYPTAPHSQSQTLQPAFIPFQQSTSDDSFTTLPRATHGKSHPSRTRRASYSPVSARRTDPSQQPAPRHFNPPMAALLTPTTTREGREVARNSTYTPDSPADVTWTNEDHGRGGTRYLNF